MPPKKTATTTKGKGKSNAKQAQVPVDPLNQPLSDELSDGLFESQRAERASELEGIQPTMTAKQKKSFEYRLQNPEKLASHNRARTGRNGENEKFPRQGLAKRQKSVMQTAAKADPFMRDLDAKGHLGDSHMERPLDRYRGDSYLRPGQRVGRKDGIVRNNRGSKIHAVGMGEFKNKEGMLPEMSGPKSRSTQGHQARQGKWSEADVNPVTLNYHDTSDDYVEARNRGAERLLHTSKNSKELKPNGKGGMSSGKVDFSQYVTTDHYHSMVPVSAVEQDYKANNPYTSKYMDPEGKKSSLELHEEKEALRLAEEAKANAPVEEAVVEDAVEASASAPEVVVEAPVVEEPKLTKKQRAALRREEEQAELMRRAKQSQAAKAQNGRGGRKKNSGKKKKKGGKRRKN